MISAFFVFNQKGEVLISRLYRTDFKRSIADVFRIQVVSNSDVRSPIITLGSTSFFHVRVNNLYVVAVTKNNANAALVFEFCYRFINIAKSYFGKIDEEAIKNNFVLIYELIDEINDFGYPQNSEIDTLKTYITTESIVSSSAVAVEESSKITAQATGATSWRRGDVKYKKNEAFVDVVETVNLSMSAKGTILRADVDGHIQMRAYLSGTPECKFGLNDKLVIDKSERGAGDAVELDDCRFHQCVRLNDFDADRSISFVPPDGEFELMRYRATSNVKLPLRIIPTVTEIGTTRVSYDVTVKTNFNNKLSATNIVLRIPTPLNTVNVECSVANGKAKYAPAENVVIWKIPRLQGGQECAFSAVAELTSTTTRQVWARPPIDVDFQVLMFTSSGLIVRFLKVFEKSNYNSIKWVRYLTKASGSYQIRLYVLEVPFIVLVPVIRAQLGGVANRFGFSAASGIDSLLDKEDVSLEAILDEDELLQECKSQNTRLIDYFQRVDVLQRLLGYVTGQIECEERGQFKYPYVATEVLCSEIWSIVETCINEQRQLLAPFWDSLLDRSPEDMKTQMVMASHFAKINAIFLSKKPAEMLAFIQSQPNVVERILHHIENPSFVDLLVRIIQLDEYQGGAGVLEWLSSQNLMAQLIERLAPQHPPELHVVVADLIKGIISLATPSPGSSVSEGLQNGTSSNLFARELARHDSVSKLVAYALQDFGPSRNVASEDDQDDKTHPPLPTFESATSSVIQSIGVVIELIRKNNSDYFEPYLFHTLRNRLMQIQHQYSSQPEHVTREALEHAMGEMVDRMGVVHLGPVLEIMNDNLHKFLEYLKSPRSSTGPVGTTVGMVLPLTFERFRICEMIAELLHCSNMSLLNRPPEQNKIYDSQGRLTGGLAGLEELAKLVDVPDGPNNDSMDDIVDDMEPSLDLPVTRSSHSPSSLDSDEDMSDDDAMEEIIMHDEPPAITPPGLSPSEPPPMLPSNADSSVFGSNTQGAALSRVDSRDTSSDSDASSTIGQRSESSRRNSKRFTIQEPPLNKPIFVGEKMKARLLELRVVPVLLDLFFEYPWNNFLHSAVYDIIHQILTGNLESGYNRELAISLFRDARLMYRIVEGQKHNDIESAKPKGVRLGYMGHLQLISEDVLIALEVFPPEVRLLIIQYAPDPDWDEYVTGRYLETKRRDNILLGGGKPIVGPSMGRQAGRWKVDEEDPTGFVGSSSTSNETNGINHGQETRGEFKRAVGARPTRESSADFGAPMDDDEDDEDDTAPRFARYLAHEMNADNFGSDDEDEDGGWLSRSTFTLGNPPAAARHQQSERRPLSVNGFDDEFDPGHRSSSAASEDPFSSADDDAFGPFSDSAAVSSNDAFFSSLSDEMEDSTFDNFGDFGDFQSASPSQDGELTPTAGSWSFASDSSEGATSSSDGSPKPQGRSLREGEERSP